MNYIYTLEQENTLTTYLTERYRHLHRYASFFLNFNIGYSIFCTPQNTLFPKIMFYPSFICVSVYIHIIYYNRDS